MGKQKDAVNKSQLIRDYFGKHPNAQNKDVAEALKKHGVNSQDVANLKARMKPSTGRRSKKKAAKKRASRKPSQAPVGLASVEAAADFVASMGGVDQAQQAIAAVAKIAEKLR